MTWFHHLVPQREQNILPRISPAEIMEVAPVVVCCTTQLLICWSAQQSRKGFVCAGKMFGRTPLIKLSPKKTWEGFVGGAIGTLFAAVVLTNFLAQYEWMYCPRRSLEFNRLHCDKPEAFIPIQYQMTDLWQVSSLFLLLEYEEYSLRPKSSAFDAITCVVVHVLSVPTNSMCDTSYVNTKVCPVAKILFVTSGTTTALKSANPKQRRE